MSENLITSLPSGLFDDLEKLQMLCVSSVELGLIIELF